MGVSGKFWRWAFLAERRQSLLWVGTSGYFSLGPTPTQLLHLTCWWSALAQEAKQGTTEPSETRRKQKASTTSLSWTKGGTKKALQGGFCPGVWLSFPFDIFWYINGAEGPRCSSRLPHNHLKAPPFRCVWPLGQIQIWLSGKRVKLHSREETCLACLSRENLRKGSSLKRTQPSHKFSTHYSRKTHNA